MKKKEKEELVVDGVLGEEDKQEEEKPVIAPVIVPKRHEPKLTVHSFLAVAGIKESHKKAMLVFADKHNRVKMTYKGWREFFASFGL